MMTGASIQIGLHSEPTSEAMMMLLRINLIVPGRDLSTIIATSRRMLKIKAGVRNNRVMNKL